MNTRIDAGCSNLGGNHGLDERGVPIYREMTLLNSVFSFADPDEALVQHCRKFIG